MQKQIPSSELVLNPDGSIYHLSLHPEHVAPTVILVGDQARVPRVSKFFDKIDHKISKREFVTHTGWLGKKRISVVSTGIGTDNIDIVLNELDALVNVDLKTRMVKAELTSLDLIRIGTSGSMRKELCVDDFLVSDMAIGLESLMQFYPHEPSERETGLRQKFTQFTKSHGIELAPYAADASPFLVEKLATGLPRGITMTCPGFYGPQGRSLRAESIYGKPFFEKCADFEFENLSLSNFEMESSGIFAMARLLGHRATSCNAILANRITNEFSSKPKETVNKLIELVLERL